MTSQVVLVWPPGRVESECVVRVLRQAGIDAVTTSPATPRVVVTVECDQGVRASLAAVPGSVTHVCLTSHHHSSGCGAQATAPGETTEALVTLVHEVLREAAPAAAIQAPDPMERLSPRELEVVTLIADGRRNDEIADELAISSHTVRTHVHRILTKLELPHRNAVAAQAVLRAGRGDDAGEASRRFAEAAGRWTC